jgi:hypothetical protein
MFVGIPSLGIDVVAYLITAIFAFPVVILLAIEIIRFWNATWDNSEPCEIEGAEPIPFNGGQACRP